MDDLTRSFINFSYVFNSCMMPIVKLKEKKIFEPDNKISYTVSY
jgi:hypothetical protein